MTVRTDSEFPSTGAPWPGPAGAADAADRGNRLLASLPTEAAAFLRHRGERVSLRAAELLERGGARIERLYFPDSGVVSVFAGNPGGRRMEVGLFGRDGASGLALLLGVDRTPHEHVVQLAGEALRVPREAVREACVAFPDLRDRWLLFVQIALVQSAHTALSHGCDVIEVRLARWILMCHDRNDGDEMALTHVQMGGALGVRRSGVTHALHLLEGRGLIRATRGCVRVIDRKGLEDAAGCSYGAPEAEFERLAGFSIRRS